MPYIGKQLVRGQNRKLDDISSGFNGSQTTFTLQVASQNVTVGSALQLWISLGGVIQDPLSDYTIAGNQITFTTAPAASLDFFGVIQGDVTDTNTPGDATVTTSKLASGLTVNLADGSAATSSLQLGGTDSGLFSSAADKVNVTTGGVERLEIGDSEVVFNDPSNDVDFRVESNGNTHMLFVDAGNDRVGIGDSSPSNALNVVGIADFDGIAGNTMSRLRIQPDESTKTAFLDARTASGNSQFAIKTGAAGGSTERFRIDGSGRLLLGSSSSQGSGRKLQVADTSAEAGVEVFRYVTSATSAPVLNFSKSKSATLNTNTAVVDGDFLGYIQFKGANGSGYNVAAQITSEVDGTPGVDDMPGAIVFSTTADGASSPTERMRIDSSGNVGIGITNPGYKIEVSQGSGNSVARFTGANSANLVFRNATSNVFELNAGGGNDELSFGTAGNNERIRINSSGNVGINASSPGRTLDVDGVIRSDGTSGSFELGGNSSTPSVGCAIHRPANNTMAFVTGTSERMRINSSGQVGIGTSSPNVYGVHANDSSNSVYFKADSSAVSTVYGSASSLGVGLFGTFSNNALAVYTNSAERMRMTTSGSLLVGRTAAYNSSPGETGVFQGAAHGVVIYQTANANYTNIILRNTYANNGGNNVSANMITFTDQGGTERGKIAMNGSSTSYITSSDYRLKENVVDINDGITRVKQLQPKRFNFIVDADTTVDGFLAHEAQTVVPEAVTGTHNEVDDDNNPVYQGIDQSKLVPLLTAALQEAIAKIETLETKVAALEAE